MARNDYIGSLVDNSLAHTEEVDLDEGEVEWGEFMMVRVKLNIKKPLVRRKKLAIDDMSPRLILTLSVSLIQ